MVLHKDRTYDLIIVGAGPTGLNCGIAAERAGLDYLIIEKGVLVNSIFNFPANMTFFSTSKNLEIAGTPFISHNDKPTRQEALEYYRRLLESNNLNIHFREPVKNVEKGEKYFKVETASAKYSTDNVIIATGFYDHANMLNVPGEDLPKVKHYYDEVHHYLKTDVVVVGGANSACDVALECWQKGAQVTMIVREPALYQNTKYWILPNIENRIKEGSITAYFNSTVKEITPDKVIFETPEGVKSIKNDYVLAMTGYKPDYDFLEKIGIDITEDDLKKPIVDEKTLESSIPGLYMAGVVLGGMKTNEFFIENTRDHGEKIVKDILLKKSWV